MSLTRVARWTTWRAATTSRRAAAAAMQRRGYRDDVVSEKDDDPDRDRSKELPDFGGSMEARRRTKLITRDLKRVLGVRSGNTTETPLEEGIVFPAHLFPTNLRTLAGTPLDVAEHIETSRVTLLTTSTNAMSAETLRPLHAAFDAHREGSDWARAIGRVDISIKQGFLFKPFHSMYERVLRGTLDERQHEHAVLLTGSTHELEMEIGMDEAASGFAYLVDQDGRVRWSKRCMPTHWRKRAEKADDPSAVEARGAARLGAIADEMVVAVAAVAAEEGVERLKTKVRR